MSKILKTVVLCLFFYLVNASSQCTISSGGDITSGLIRNAWGQSFTSRCTGKLNKITFKAASATSTNYTLSIYSETHELLYKRTQGRIKVGENTVKIPGSITVRESGHYYFNIESDSQWRIKHSGRSNVDGNLNTHYDHSPSSARDWNFNNYDLNFSVDVTEEIDLFIWAGQSNAQGFSGDAAFYPADPEGLDQQIRFNWTVPRSTSSSYGWVTLQAQSGRFPSGHFGPEVSFARKLKKTGFNPAIFKYTEPGTSIRNDWKGIGGGGLFDSFAAKIRAAISDLEQQGHIVNVRGAVWIQGESDATNEREGHYYSGLTHIINYIRNDIAHDRNLPVILGVDEQISTILTNPLVLQNHYKIAEDDLNIRFSSMYGFPKADGTHLTPAGLIPHGERVYEEMFKLLDYKISSYGNEISGMIEPVWGQSFIPPYSGTLKEISFNAASDVHSPFTFTVRSGTGADASVVYSRRLYSIRNGENRVVLTIPLTAWHGYYLSIKSDNLTPWRVRFSNNDKVLGRLKTSSNANGTLSDISWKNFDMDFDLKIERNDSVLQ